MTSASATVAAKSTGGEEPAPVSIAARFGNGGADAHPQRIAVTPTSSGMEPRLRREAQVIGDTNDEILTAEAAALDHRRLFAFEEGLMWATSNSTMRCLRSRDVALPLSRPRASEVARASVCAFANLLLRCGNQP